MRVKDLMQQQVVILHPDQTLKEVLDIFAQHKIYGAPVVNDQGELVGICTKSSLMAIIRDRISVKTKVSEVMARDVYTLSPNAPLENICRLGADTGCTKFPVVDDEGKLQGVITSSDMLRFISKKGRQMMNERDILLNFTHNGIIVIDEQGFIQFLNQAAREMFHIESENSVGKHVSYFNPQSPLLEVIASGKPQVAQRERFGENTVVSNSTPVIVDGKVVGAIAVFQDITRLESIAGELEEVKTLKSILDTIVENPYEGVMVIDSQCNITMVNQYYAEVLGHKKEDIIGRPVWEVVPNTRLPEILETGEVQIGEFWQINNLEWIIMRVPIKKDGKIIGAMGKSLLNANEAQVLMKKIQSLQDQLDYFRDEVHREWSSRYTFDHIVGTSRTMQFLIGQAKTVARTTSTILLMGESGTGKELFAHAIHSASPRRNGPFIKINCAAVPENLLESELFGYVDGAFTGAKKGGKPGKFEMANGGTIFLDEIGDMSLSMQAKLLRVLQEREVERVGGQKTIQVDVRVIAATNKDLEALVRKRQFREDLYYRLNVVTLNTPPLREHKEDIPTLVNDMIKRLNRTLGSNVCGITPETLDLFMVYDWPGNIRELENLIERAINFAEELYLKPDNFPGLIKKLKHQIEPVSTLRPLMETIDEAEKQAIVAALQASNNNRQQAARMLNIHRSILYRKLNKYSLQ
ncbi:MAG: sigma 54-interacting transcriptional regulator [Firmicutes bacterium]|nr:sigma 54-interacting transcriptional regulator [Bacillota bacterium]